MTVLAHLLSVFQHSASYNRHDLARPSVILWTDGERLWEKAARLIASSCPGFSQLDESELGEFSGPSTWVRYQLGMRGPKRGRLKKNIFTQPLIFIDSNRI